MDSLTQIVLGAGVGEVILGKKVGNKAMLWGAAAGTIPDLDVLAALLTNPLQAMIWHRGFMHSIVFCAAFAPLLGWLIHKISKKNNATIKEWSVLCWWALVTHPLLDCFTTWGTQLFWPFDVRITFNGVFVIDPLYTLPFLAFLIVCMRLPRESLRRKKLSRFALYISTAYLFLGLGFRQIAKSTFEARLNEEEIAYRSIDVKPMPFTNLYWECTAEGEAEFYNAHYSLLGKKENIRFRAIAKNHDLDSAFRNHSLYQDLLRISKGYYALETKNDTLLFHDLRFGQTDGISGQIERRSNFVYLLQIDNNHLKFNRRSPAIAQGFSYLCEYFSKVVGAD